VREFLDALLAPVRELIAAILRPIGEALRWLLGLLPDIGLNLSVPDWLVDVLVPVIVVLVVFVATYSGLRNRREKLAETASAARAGTSVEAETSAESEARTSDDAAAGTSRRADPEGEDYGAETSSQDVPSRAARNSARSAGESSRQN
jgi:flagellar biosynthesis/type III secretory pathway M-ring protein FliF/YscJ